MSEEKKNSGKVEINAVKKKGTDSKRKLTYALVGTIGAIVMVNTLLFGNSGTPVKTAAPEPKRLDLTPAGVVQQSFETRTQSELGSLRASDKAQTKAMEELVGQIKDMKDKQGSFEARANENFRNISEQLTKIQSATSGSGVRLPSPDAPMEGPLPVAPPKAPPGPPQPFGGNNATPDLQPKIEPSVIAAPKKKGPLVLEPPSSDSDKAIETVPVKERYVKNKYAGYLSPGFVDAVMLTGVQASVSASAQENPQPVMFRVQSNAVLPGGGLYDLESCFVFAAAHGNAPSQRAYMQLANLSCLDQRRHVVLETPIEGYVVDSDGGFGLRGEIIERRGAALAKATFASIFGGLGEAFSEAQGTVFDSLTGGNSGKILDGPAALKSAGFSGLSGGANTLEKFYLDEAQNLFPVIEIPPRRKVTLIIQRGKQLEWNDYGPLYIKQIQPTAR